jgi:hypothetical protein
VIRGALGLRAANTISLKTYPDADKPLAAWLYSRWHRGQEDIPYAFSVGATVRPTNSRFLAVPATLNIHSNAASRGGVQDRGLAGTSYAAGQIMTSLFGGGSRDSLGRFRGGANWDGKRRMTPRLLESQMGIKLRYVPPMGGRRFGMLVVDGARLSTKTGRLQRGQSKRPKVTVVAFLLLPQTKVPRILDWDSVIGRAQELLAQDVLAALPPNVLDAVQTGTAAGVPQFEVATR